MYIVNFRDCQLKGNFTFAFIVIISSDRVTNWGTWGEWSYCPEGSYAYGITVKVEKRVNLFAPGDDTALNAIAVSNFDVP